MTYSDFTLQAVLDTFHIALRQETMFPQVVPVEVPALLRDVLDEGLSLALVSEKARSELIVMPILLTVRRQRHRAISIYSGQRLDIDPSSGLMGECDFILSAAPALPILQSPIIMLVEAKKNDIDGGLGQCAAQMIGARLFNERTGSAITSLYGCVTTGEAWQFLKLEQQMISIDMHRYYINDVGTLLGVFQAMLAHFGITDTLSS